MTFPIFVLIYLCSLQALLGGGKFAADKYFKCIVGFFSIVILNSLRLYCQYYFPDIPNYELIFEEIDSLPLAINSESGLEYKAADVDFGFRLIISIFKTFSNDFQLFLFFIFAFQLFSFYFFCKSIKISFFISLPIYFSLTFLSFQIGMLRQAVAFCFLLFALIAINKKIIYLLLIGLGATFHKSILICLFLIWSNKRVGVKKFCIIFFVAIALYLLRVDIISGHLASLEDYDAIGRITYYMNVDREDNFLGIGFVERVIFFIAMIAIYLKLDHQGRINQFNNLIFNLGIISILSQIVFFASPTITSRLRYYLIIFPYIFVSQYIQDKNSGLSKWLFLILFDVILFAYLIYQGSYLE